MFNIDSNGRLEALRIALQDAARFTLIFIEVPVGPARDELLQRLRAWSGIDEVPLLRFVALGPSESPWNALQALALAPGERAGVVLTGLEQFNVGGSLSPTVHVMNLARDLLSRTVPGPLVILADAATLRAISEQMPDLYSWRSFETQVQPVGIPPISIAREPSTTVPQATAREELERLRDLLAKLPEDAPQATPLKLRLAHAAFDAFKTDEAASILATLGEPSADAEPLLAAHWAELAGDIALRRSDHDTARLRYEQALPLYHKAGDLLGEANCIFCLGDLAQQRSDHDTARLRFEHALSLYREHGVLLGEANCITSLGNIALRCSDHDTARQRYEQALPLYHKAGDLLGEANCIQRLGLIALRHSDHDTAHLRFEHALPLYRKLGATLGEANCIKGRGDIALQRADLDTARQCYEHALPIYRKIGDLLGEANCIRGLGNIALQRADHDTARQCDEQALPLYRKAGDLLGEANCIRGLGDLDLQRADDDTARQRYQHALNLYQRIPVPYSVGATHLRLAHLATSEDARDHHIKRAREAWSSIGRLDLIEKHLDDATALAPPAD